jgi:hypothetical protein
MPSKEIHIFDMDDTLLWTPHFSDFVEVGNNGVVDISGDFSSYLKKIKSYFSIVFSKEIFFVKSGDFIVVYDSKHKQPLTSEYVGYIQDLDPDSFISMALKRKNWKEMLRMFEEKDGFLVLKPFPGFHSDPRTLGKRVNEPVYNIYKKAHNKMILTGRGENMRSEIEQNLKEIGVEAPNEGLMLYSGNDGIMNFKVQVVLDSIEKNGWEKVFFYEDRKDWLDAVENAVKEKFPEVQFVSNHITNVKLSKQV